MVNGARFLLHCDAPPVGSRDDADRGARVRRRPVLLAPLKRVACPALAMPLGTRSGAVTMLQVAGSMPAAGQSKIQKRPTDMLIALEGA